MGETNQVKWRGIRPTDPPEPIPICDKTGDRLFSFKATLAKEHENLNLPAGDAVINGDPVPEGEIWNILLVCFTCQGTAPSRFVCIVTSTPKGIVLVDEKSPVVDQWYVWSGSVYLKQGERIRLYISGTNAGSEGYLRYAGTIMKAT